MKVTLRRKGGAAIKSYKAGSMYRSEAGLVNFSIIGPWTRSYLEGDPAPLLSALEAKGNESADGALALEDFPSTETVRHLMLTWASEGYPNASNTYAVALATIVGRSRDEAIMDAVALKLHDKAWAEQTMAAKEFVSLLDFYDSAIRRGAAWMLGEIGDPTASEGLGKIAQTDKDSTIRQAANDALHKINR